MVALCMVPGIGSIGAKRILAYAGTSESVFRLDRGELMKIPGVGVLLAERILDKGLVGKAEKELEFTRENNIRCMFFTDSDYPYRLGHCEDAPPILYVRGDLDLDHRKTLSVVGTRRPSPQGLELCRRLIGDLARRHPDLVVVSGLAYGIDHCAHRSALDCGLDTVAVLGHGLKFMYPSLHRSIARKIEASGALVTDFTSGERPERNNFIKRNRIIAGLSEATVVVESGAKGGALITADLANSYNRDVFAFPGRPGDAASAGCNGLIKSHRACLIENYRDVEYQLGWEVAEDLPLPVENTPVRELSREERSVLEVLDGGGDVSMDLLCFQTGLPVSRISGILLDLELSGLVLGIPGDCYRLNRR